MAADILGGHLCWLRCDALGTKDGWYLMKMDYLRCRYATPKWASLLQSGHQGGEFIVNLSFGVAYEITITLHLREK